MFKKISVLGCLIINGLVFADVPVTSTTDMVSTYHTTGVYQDSMQNLEKLISSVNQAQNINGQISALQNLKDFTKDPEGATDEVNNIVKNMLNNFNSSSGTNFGNLQELIAGLSSSTTATGMSLKLQQSTAAQLQNMNVLLKQIEAENQAVLRYKQADIALKKKQADDLKAQREKTANNM
jgi:hypothetical protein